MAMTADDMLKLRDKFITIGTYKVDQDKVNDRLTCVEKKQESNDLIVVRIDTQLKILMWLTSIIVVAVVGMLVKMLWS